jgi:hypothetical protein
MKIQISMVDLVDATTKAGKPYQVVEVTYKNLSFQGKVESRKIMPFGTTADTAKALKDAQKGDLFEITAVKNDKGFNDWTAAVPSSEGAPSPAPAQARSYPTASAPSAPVAKSTYETPEERAKRQVFIVRQSSITAALTFLNNTMMGTAKELYTTIDVLAVAKEFENYVFGLEIPPKAPASVDEDMDDLPE